MRLALPAGPLLRGARELLARAGVEAETDPRDPFSIPQRVADGEFAAGLCGLDHVHEADLEPIAALLDLGLDPTDLVVASLNTAPGPETVASEYPRISRRWAEVNRLPNLRVLPREATDAARADLFLGRVPPGRGPEGGTVRERILRATTWLIARRDAVRTEGPDGPLHALVGRLKQAGIRREILGTQHPSALADPAREGWDRWGRSEEGW